VLETAGGIALFFSLTIDDEDFPTLSGDGREIVFRSTGVPGLIIDQELYVMMRTCE
jgi:hypothetical protein